MRNPMFLVVACLCAISALGQGSSHSAPLSATKQADVAEIEQIEDQWLKAERTTDAAILERVLAEDFAGIGPNGPTPGKEELLKNWQPHAGQAPPYTVEVSEMHLIVRGDTAVAAYTKTYSAKENGNRAHQDVTDVFTKDQGQWKLRISRSSSRDH